MCGHGLNGQQCGMKCQAKLAFLAQADAAGADIVEEGQRILQLPST